MVAQTVPPLKKNACFFFFYSNRVDGGVLVWDVFFAVRQPEATDTRGLYVYLDHALQYIGVDDWKNKLVGFGSDGASVNMVAGSLQGLSRNRYFSEGCSQTHFLLKSK